jgi:hypothetical protein
MVVVVVVVMVLVVAAVAAAADSGCCDCCSRQLPAPAFPLMGDDSMQDPRCCCFRYAGSCFWPCPSEERASACQRNREILRT